MKSVDKKPQFLYAFITMPKLWKRANGSYYVVWQEQGQQRKRSLKTADQKIARQLFNAFKRDLILKKVSPIGAKLNITLPDFKTEFLSHIEATLSRSSYECYETSLNHAIDCFGAIPVSHITHRHIDRYMTDLLKSGLKIPTVNKNRRHLKAALQKAYEWDYLKSPAKFPSALAEEQHIRFLTKKELSKIVSKSDDPEFTDVILLAAYTGLRSSEILRLTRDDIDNPEGFLRISPQQKNKTESWIPINETARTVLERCAARGHNRITRFKTRQTLSKLFKKTVREANLPHARFHDLRHTFGSHLAMLDVGEKTIQELMRHKSIASTMVYTHVSPKHLTEASSKINYGPMEISSRKSGQKTGQKALSS